MKEKPPERAARKGWIKMKKAAALVLLLACLLGLAGCTRTMNDIIAKEPSVKGIVRSFDRESVVIENESGTYSVSLNVECKDSITHFEIGDEIVVYYDGKAAEGDPMRIDTVYAITLRTPASRTEKN